MWLGWVARLSQPTSALPDQGVISAFLHGWFSKLLCSQEIGRSTPLAGKLGVGRSQGGRVSPRRVIGMCLISLDARHCGVCFRLESRHFLCIPFTVSFHYIYLSSKEKTMELSVAEIWRYPIKSFAGERLETACLTTNGIPYDRYWAVRDTDTGDILGGRSQSELVKFSAQYCAEPTEKRQVAQIEFPDGFNILTDDNQLDKKLSDALGRSVTLSSVRPATDMDYYQRPQAIKFTPEKIRRAFELGGQRTVTRSLGKNGGCK